MTTIADLEEQQLRQHLIDGGFLSSFTDVNSVAQPAPMTQMLELDLTQVETDDRVVFIRNIGGVSNAATNTLFVRRNMLVSVISQTESTDSIITKVLARDMEQYLKANIVSATGCIFDIQTSGVNGPFTTKDNRRAYEINLQVSFNINRPVF